MPIRYAAPVIGSIVTAMSPCLATGVMPPVSMRAIDDGWTTIPTEYSGQYFFVLLRINDRGPYRFLVDSGAFPSLIDTALAETLPLPKSDPPRGAAGSSDVRFVDARLGGDGINFEPETILVADIDRTMSEAIGRRIQGVLGADFLNDRVVELDYAAPAMRTRSSAGFAASAGDHVIPLRLAGRPFILMTLRADAMESFGALVLVDTGSGGSLDCHESITRKFGLPGALPTVTTGGRNLTGDHESIAFRLESAAVGNIQIDQPILQSMPDEARPPGAGDYSTLGADILSKFTVTFDFARQRMLLRPNATEKDPIDISSNGLGLVARGESFDRVEAVVVSPGSPATDAGFRPGDVLRTVDGRAVHDFEFQALRKYLQDAIERPVVIEFTRDGADLSCTMTPTRRLKLRE